MKSFRELRLDNNYHLGLGDIRLTIAMQDEIEREIEDLRLERERRIYYQDILSGMVSTIEKILGTTITLGSYESPVDNIREELIKKIYTIGGYKSIY